MIKLAISEEYTDDETKKNIKGKTLGQRIVVNSKGIERTDKGTWLASGVFGNALLYDPGTAIL